MSCSKILAVKVQTIELGYHRTHTGENCAQSRIKSADNLNFPPITSQGPENTESISFPEFVLIQSYFK